MMIKSILKTTFLLFFLMSAQISSAQEAVLITKEDVAAEGLIDDNHPINLSCNDTRKMNEALKVYMEFDEFGNSRQYVYQIITGHNSIISYRSMRYRLLYAKKAYKDLSRSFSFLMPKNEKNNTAVVVYYPSFPTYQELFDALDKCKELTGDKCHHAVFYDKENTSICFPIVDGPSPSVFNFFQHLREQD